MIIDFEKIPNEKKNLYTRIYNTIMRSGASREVFDNEDNFKHFIEEYTKKHGHPFGAYTSQWGKQSSEEVMSWNINGIILDIDGVGLYIDGVPPEQLYSRVWIRHYSLVPKEYKKIFFKNLQQMLEKKKINSSEICDRIGKSRAYIHYLLANDADLDFDTAVRIAIACETGLDYMFNINDSISDVNGHPDVIIVGDKHLLLKASCYLPSTMRIGDLCKYLGISLNHAYKVINTKGFPAYKIGSNIHIDKEKFIKWMEERIEDFHKSDSHISKMEDE